MNSFAIVFALRNQLLIIAKIPFQRSYIVTATVRSEKRASEIIKAHPNWEGKIEFAIVEDFTTAAPFDIIFEKAKDLFTYIIHTASPLRFSVNDIQKEMIEPAEKG